MNSVQASCAPRDLVTLGRAESTGVVGGEDICLAIPTPPWGRPVVICGPAPLMMIVKTILS